MIKYITRRVKCQEINSMGQRLFLWFEPNRDLLNLYDSSKHIKIKRSVGFKSTTNKGYAIFLYILNNAFRFQENENCS